MSTVNVKFSVGQLVHHKKFDYRGVVVDVDPRFQGTEDWYEQVAKSRPPKDKPWYHVLVHEAGINTYVAERHLEPDLSEAPINHPAVGQYFSDFRGGSYVPRAIN
ncbi:MAG TPA: heat shock protein HspQ [Gammaproteobacteria bacterium]|nr:heat shock protein HspQ [Gammaproteobacteria bacterium]